MSFVMKKAVLLGSAAAALDQAVSNAHTQGGSPTLKNAVGATLNPVFMLQGTDPNGKVGVKVKSNWKWDAKNWRLDAKAVGQNDGRSEFFVKQICEANGGGRWQVGTTDGSSPAERWEGKKSQWKNNKVWAKLYDKMMQKPGSAWWGKIFSTGNEVDNANNGKGDGKLRKKDDDETKSALNHPKNVNKIDLQTDLKNAMEDSLLWQYKNVHKSTSTHPWAQKDFRQASNHAEQNGPLYEAFYGLMGNWHNTWTTYQLLLNPSPKSTKGAPAPCQAKSYNPSEKDFRQQFAHRPFSPENMPDAAALAKFQTELNKRDGIQERVAGVFAGGFDAGRYVARATMDLSRAEKCLRKDVDAAEQYLQSGDFDQQTMVSFWKSLQQLANNWDDDGSLEWLVNLASDKKQNPTVGKQDKEPVEQCPHKPDGEADKEKPENAEAANEGLAWGWWVLIIVSILIAIGGIVALTLFLCVSSEPTDDL